MPLSRCRNLNYWDSVSTLAGEVRDPSRTFPRAMLLAVALVVSMYLLPTMASLGIMPPDAAGETWKLGFYGKVAQMVGGKWLAVWVLLAAAFSQVRRVAYIQVRFGVGAVG
jgi:amino acid transporter